MHFPDREFSNKITRIYADAEYKCSILFLTIKKSCTFLCCTVALMDFSAYALWPIFRENWVWITLLRAQNIVRKPIRSVRILVNFSFILFTHIYRFPWPESNPMSFVIHFLWDIFATFNILSSYYAFVSFFLSICIYLQSTFAVLNDRIGNYDSLISKSNFADGQKQLIEIIKFHVGISE